MASEVPVRSLSLLVKALGPVTHDLQLLSNEAQDLLGKAAVVPKQGHQLIAG